MKHRELLAQLQVMTPEQLDMDLTIRSLGDNEYYPATLKFADNDQDILDFGHPFFEGIDHNVNLDSPLHPVWKKLNETFPKLVLDGMSKEDFVFRFNNAGWDKQMSVCTLTEDEQDPVEPVLRYYFRTPVYSQIMTVQEIIGYIGRHPSLEF